MQDFQITLKFAFKWEVGNHPNGGYTNDPDDPGGETKYGVSKRSYPDLDIYNLTLEAAEAIYFEDYWLSYGKQKSRCDSLPWPLNFAHFDCTVNIGNWKTTREGNPLFHGRANMILQRAAGVDDDGIIGPLSMMAIEGMDPMILSKEAIHQRDIYYDTRGNWANKYKKGWHNRTRDLSLAIQGDHEKRN
jgi:lysozyme family protein